MTRENCSEFGQAYRNLKQMIRKYAKPEQREVLEHYVTMLTRFEQPSAIKALNEFIHSKFKSEATRRKYQEYIIGVQMAQEVLR